MKIAVTTSGEGLDAPLDTRFGRAARFVVYDTETKTSTVLDNTQNLNAAQGAGIQSAQQVAASGAQAVISGHFGPKAFRVLQTAGIAAYPCAAATVRETLALFEQGGLTAAQAADVEGHWI